MQNLIPQPVTVTPAEGVFHLTADCKIVVEPPGEEWLAIGNHLAEQLRADHRLSLPVVGGDAPLPAKRITLKMEPAQPHWGSEGYRLAISPQAVEIAASRPAGAFHGVQTLRQLAPLPPLPAEISCGIISDQPRYPWRGAMLDVARHFFGVEEIKHYLDLLAAYKFNILHLHLTDDQGWRIEIKSWPKLTEIGSKTAINGDPGGCYTQAEYAEIVAYARSRYITIVPEIDLPGHTNAALASYPELNCNGEAPAPYTGGKVGFSSLCIHKEITYQFINDVIREIAALTPGEYLHIGGDEAQSTPEADYKQFIERVDGIVKQHGKKMIGWEEIAQCSLSPDTVAQYWININHAKMAAQKGMTVLLSPAQRAYLDIKYDPSTPLGLGWAGTTNTEKSYRWEPAAEVPGLPEEHILGVEAPLWSETLRTMADVEFMAFPRLLGIAEIGWSAAEGRHWDEYRLRLAAEGRRLAAWGVNFYRDPGVPWESAAGVSITA